MTCFYPLSGNPHLINMNSSKKKNINEIPVMTLSDMFETLKAVGRGDQVAANWAGKKVYII
jgi:hypothetical protein